MDCGPRARLVDAKLPPTCLLNDSDPRPLVVLSGSYLTALVLSAAHGVWKNSCCPGRVPPLMGCPIRRHPAVPEPPRRRCSLPFRVRAAAVL